jgi:hypothetical protein
MDGPVTPFAALPVPAARMLAVETLLADPEALGDDVLESCLYLPVDPCGGRRGVQGGTWDRAVLFGVRGVLGSPLLFDFDLDFDFSGGGVESLFLTSPSCSLRW